MLTAKQIKFLRLIGISVPESAEPASAAGDAGLVLQGLGKMSLPDGASDADKQEFSRRSGEIRQMMEDDATDETVVAAGDLLMDLENWLSEVKAQIIAYNDAVNAILAKAAVAADDLRDDATERERQAVSDLVDAVKAAADGPRESAPDQATVNLAELNAAVTQANEAAAERETQRAERMNAVDEGLRNALAALDPEAEKVAIDQAAASIRVLTAGPPSEQAVDDAEAQLADLRLQIEAANKLAVADRERRDREFDALLSRVGTALKIEDAHPDDILALDKLIATLRGLEVTQKDGTTPSDSDLATCLSEVSAMETAAGEVADKVAERRQRFDRATAVLARLQPDASGLKPHDRAPPEESAAIHAKAQQLASTHAAMLDWEKVIDLKDEDIQSLETAVIAIEAEILSLNNEVERRITEIAQLVTDVRNACANPPGTQFSKLQADHFAAKITEQETLFQKEPGQHAQVKSGLETLQKTLAQFASDLAAVKVKLANVVPPDPAKLTVAEKTALDQAKTAAEEAIEKALPT